MTSPRRTRFQEPRLTATPQERRKLATLVVLAGVVILLLWISTAPWNYRTRSSSRISEFFGTIGRYISDSQDTISDRKTNTTNSSNSNQPNQ